VQLYVGDVEDANHEIHGGISFQMPRQGWPINRAVVFDEAKAAEFVEFLMRLEDEQIPCSISFPRHDGDLRWEVQKVRSNWHGGGGLSGHLYGNWLADHSNPTPVTITRESIALVRKCISERYLGASRGAA
jgi:hypothetical protein